MLLSHSLSEYIFSGFIFAIIPLSTTNHILITINPHISLVAYPYFLVYHFGPCLFVSLWSMLICSFTIYRLNVLSCHIRSVFVVNVCKKPSAFTYMSLRYCSVIIGIFQMCLALCVITLLDLLSSICMINHCGLCHCSWQSPHVSMVHYNLFVWLLYGVWEKKLNLYQFQCSLNICPARISGPCSFHCQHCSSLVSYLLGVGGLW